ncbi:hypothetical protein NDU88_010072 [Pleurodeles waltl]|uniref:Uncharacterized protein n=1 Tax=Pleurodeles waltl TaxID=8319 RepID=A0AAV7RYF9_PLEWA|nr:hypothetical protein NDU88_010072 [Pleurodeles waltl]
MEDLISRLFLQLQVTHSQPSAGSAQATVRGDSCRPVAPLGCRNIARPHPRTRLITLLCGRGRSCTSLLGRSGGAGEPVPLGGGFWSLLSEARVQPSRGSEVSAILVLRGRRGDTLFPPQPLFFARRCLHRIYWLSKVGYCCQMSQDPCMRFSTIFCLEHKLQYFSVRRAVLPCSQGMDPYRQEMRLQVCGSHDVLHQKGWQHSNSHVILPEIQVDGVYLKKINFCIKVPPSCFEDVKRQTQANVPACRKK